MKLKESIIKCKEKLSASGADTVYIIYIYKQINFTIEGLTTKDKKKNDENDNDDESDDYEGNLSVKKIQEILQNKFIDNRLFQMVEKSVELSGINDEEKKKLIMTVIGGSLRIPFMKAQLEKYLKSINCENELNQTMNIEESVAYGCSYNGLIFKKIWDLKVDTSNSKIERMECINPDYDSENEDNEKDENVIIPDTVDRNRDYYQKIIDECNNYINHIEEMEENAFLKNKYETRIYYFQNILKEHEGNFRTDDLVKLVNDLLTEHKKIGNEFRPNTYYQEKLDYIESFITPILESMKELKWKQSLYFMYIYILFIDRKNYEENEEYISKVREMKHYFQKNKYIETQYTDFVNEYNTFLSYDNEEIMNDKNAVEIVNNELDKYYGIPDSEIDPPDEDNDNDSQDVYVLGYEDEEDPQVFILSPKKEVPYDPITYKKPSPKRTGIKRRKGLTAPKINTNLKSKAVNYQSLTPKAEKETMVSNFDKLNEIQKQRRNTINIAKVYKPLISPTSSSAMEAQTTSHNMMTQSQRQARIKFDKNGNVIKLDKEWQPHAVYSSGYGGKQTRVDKAESLEGERKIKKKKAKKPVNPMLAVYNPLITNPAAIEVPVEVVNLKPEVKTKENLCPSMDCDLRVFPHPIKGTILYELESSRDRIKYCVGDYVLMELNENEYEFCQLESYSEEFDVYLFSFYQRYEIAWNDIISDDIGSLKIGEMVKFTVDDVLYYNAIVDIVYVDPKARIREISHFIFYFRTYFYSKEADRFVMCEDGDSLPPVPLIPLRRIEAYTVDQRVIGYSKKNKIMREYKVKGVKFIRNQYKCDLYSDLKFYVNNELLETEDGVKVILPNGQKYDLLKEGKEMYIFKIYI